MRLLLGLMDSQDRLGWILEILQRLHCREVQSVPIFVISKPDQVTFMFKQILGFVDLHTSPLDLAEDCGVAINYPVLQQEVFSILPASGYLQNSQIKSKNLGMLVVKILEAAKVLMIKSTIFLMMPNLQV